MPVDDRAFRMALDAMVARVEAAARKTATDAALITQAAAQKLAPVLTGTLRRSLHTEPAVGVSGVYVAKMGPTVVYARRIELGFQGADSLGRVYNQQPNPYVKPGRDESIPAILALARSRFRTAIRG